MSRYETNECVLACQQGSLVLEFDPKQLLTPDWITKQLALKASEMIAKYEYREVIDLGTGTGVVACTFVLQARSPAVHVTATDIDQIALATAGHNLKKAADLRYRGQFHPFTLVQADWLKGMQGYRQGKLDFIFANPPFLTNGEISCTTWEHQIPRAVYGTQGGLEDYWKILTEAREVIHPGGTIMLRVPHTKWKQDMVAKFIVDAFPRSHYFLHTSDKKRSHGCAFVVRV